jgi:hypothetical protein
VQYAALADINRDGYPDLVLARRQQTLDPAPSAVMFWDPAVGQFAPGQEDLGNCTSQAVAVADFDADGWLDLVFASQKRDEGCEIFLSASGTFSSTPTQTIDFDFVTSGIAVGDFDRDGDVDIVTANTQRNDMGMLVNFAVNNLWSNDGAGTFSLVGAVGPQALESIGVATADVDRDGDLDLVFANRRVQSAQSGQNQVYRNDGSGVFSLFQTFGSADERSQELTLGDFDGDGWVDVVIANLLVNLDKTEIRLNDRTGRFVSTVGNPVPSDARGASAADIDGDGDLDVVIALGMEAKARVLYVR